MLTMTISRFSVLSTLDHEGRSLVYLAEDPANGRKVAIKVMAGRLSSDPKARRRFEREAQNAAALAHHGFVEIYETGLHEGRPFVAMEYVDGKTLTRQLGTGGPFKIPEVVRLAGSLGEALAFAHTHNIHGLALDCSNVMVTPEGDYRILELGVTDSDDHRRTMPETEPPEVIVRWSPEMTKGQPGGPPSDHWRLGLVLYECLTGRRPFEGSTTGDILHRIRETPPKRPTSLRTGTPPGLEALILRCLEKEPERRYPRIEEFVADLGALPGARPLVLESLAVAPPSPSVGPAGVVPPLAPVPTPSSAHAPGVAAPGVAAPATPAPAPAGASVTATPPTPTPPPVPEVPAPRHADPVPQTHRGRPWLPIALAILAVLAVVAFLILSK